MQEDFDFSNLLHEAQKRWLKPSEVFYILQNHEKCQIMNEPPKEPPSGSLFLFNRRILRYFRKDGHSWRKKKGGRTIGEAHERLKVGNVDALNCYYAHGEKNPYFQRRSYWMFDPAFEHIVLVHYREVAEGRYINSSVSKVYMDSSLVCCPGINAHNSLIHDFTSTSSEFHEPNQNSSSSVSIDEVSSKFEGSHSSVVNNTGYHDAEAHPEIHQLLKTLAFQLSLDDEDDEGSNYFREKIPPYDSSPGNGDCQDEDETINPIQNPCGISQGDSNFTIHCEVAGSKGMGQSYSPSNYDIGQRVASSWNSMLQLSSISSGTSGGGASHLLALEEVEAEKLVSSWEDEQKVSENFRTGLKNSENNLQSQKSEITNFPLASDSQQESVSLASHLPKIDNFLQFDPETSVLVSTPMIPRWEDGSKKSENILLDADNGFYISDFPGMWSDQCHDDNLLSTDSFLTVSQRQRFSIREISPEWGFSSEKTKVIIIGDFLCDPLECPWAVMFGNIEVPAEIVQKGVFRCQTPQHIAGIVSLCVTSGNRESCSQVREFEFRTDHNASDAIEMVPQTIANISIEEVLLLARFAHILSFGGCDSSFIPNDCIGLVLDPTIKLEATENKWGEFVNSFTAGGQNPSVTIDWIMQQLFKDKLQQWFLSKYHESGNDGFNSLLSKQEQCIIHIISGLGYEWALNSILNVGVNVNFRDSNGWTALHWAAYFGREKMVAVLLTAGASAGAVTDPTSQDPVGKTAAFIASLRGHSGLAGYLSEVSLTSHLASLTLEESEVSKVSAAVEAERAVEMISERSDKMHFGGTEDQLSLKDSLAAVRNAAQAAARIQAAFRAHSFRKRRQALVKDFADIAAEDIQSLSAASKLSRAYSREQKLDKAALSIQKNYRSHKERSGFLKLRNTAVKIQAHVRGYQVRRKYKEFIWSVNILEKVVLRWRRKRVGLRGYRVDTEPIDEGEDDDIIKVFRKIKVDAALEEALTRVLSMVHSPKAMQQYRRMLESYRQAKELTVEDALKFRQDLQSSFHYDMDM